MAAVLGEEPAVYIRHSAVPGRLRLAVGYLYRCPERKRPLEEVILGVEGVRSASANPLTGSLLIQFDPAVCSIPLLVRAAEDALGRGDEGTGGRGDAEARGRGDLETRRRGDAVTRGEGGRLHPRPLPHGEKCGVRCVSTAPSSPTPPPQGDSIPPLPQEEIEKLPLPEGEGRGEGSLERRPNDCPHPNPLPLRWERELYASVSQRWEREREASHGEREHTQHSALSTQNPGLRTQDSGLGTQDLPPPWHALPAPEVATLLNADTERGLSNREAAARRRRSGANRLPEPEEPSLLGLLASHLLNAPTALLAVGAAFSITAGAFVDAVLIGGVLAANALIGAATERSGQRAILALRRTVPIRARVLRDGSVRSVDAADLVPGDVVQLLPGDPVPADARVIEAHHLQLEESALTGEPHAVEKSAEPSPENATLADRHSMIYRGSTVVGGRGKAVVVATGSKTAIGGLRILAAEAEAPRTPLQRDLDAIGRATAAASGAIALGMVGLSLMRGVPLASALGTAVALGVAALPEGLPALATTVLALGSGRMRRKGTLIRSLNAAEALGSVTVVCADKTGTLTENRMVVGEYRVDNIVARPSGRALSPLGGIYSHGKPVHLEDNPALAEVLKIGVLCSDAEIAGQRDGELSIDGSPTEGALLVAALKGGIDVDELRAEYPRIDRIDRSDGRRYMVTVHRGPEGLLALAKGAPDEILEMSSRFCAGGDVAPLDEEKRASLRQQNAEMAGKAMRVLAFARKQLPERYGEADLSEGFDWCGLAGLVDPIRPAAPEAIKALHRAGIRTVMITGDQAATAAAVARQLGLLESGPLHLLEAGDLASLDREVLRGLVSEVEVFARIPPEMKLAIVKALQANGEVVAMTGDGVNDAPALRAADVGVAMGQRGTELARELADVVLSTDDFSKMVDAVEEGRLVRANVRRVLHYLFSTNASEVWAVALSVALGLPSPLTPAQLLWLNLISDLAPALGLATEPSPPDLMKQPPQDPREPIVPPALQRRILGESAALAAGSLLAYGLGLLRHGSGPHARTMAFWSLATAQLLHVPMARAGELPVLQYGRPFSRALALGFGASALLQAAVLLVPPLRGLLGAVPLKLIDWLISLLAAVAPIAAIELQRTTACAALPAPIATTEEASPLKEAA